MSSPQEAGRTVSVIAPTSPVRGFFRPRPWVQARCARTYSGRRRPGMEPRTAYVLVSGVRLAEERRSVKPSAQPTLVRTQHLPPPAETARWLRKRGPAGRFLLVPPRIRACHCESMHGSVHVHIADSVRAKLAVRITARFADPRPFRPVTRAPECRASRLAGSSPCCSRQAAGWPCLYPRLGRALPDRPAPSHRGSMEGMTGCASPPLGWKTSARPHTCGT